MAIGFDERSVDALVVHGYPFEGITHAQGERLATAVFQLGSGLIGAPNGDMSQSGTAVHPESPLPFTFVVGALVARAGTAAQDDATTQSATVNLALCEKGAATFEAARPVLDGVLKSLGLTPGVPGTFLLAAGPLATAMLEGAVGATIQRTRGVEDTGQLSESLTVVHGRDLRAPRIEVAGAFILSARYA